MEDEDLIFRQRVSVRAIPDSRGRYQAKEWFNSLDFRDRKRAEAGLQSFDLSFETKRGYAGRLEKVEGSALGLLELRLTRGGTPGPQLRMMGVWRGATFYAALGFRKTSRRIKQGDIQAAEATLRGWTGDPKRERSRRKGLRRA